MNRVITLVVATIEICSLFTYHQMVLGKIQT
jgi:hypothetical protein